MRTIYVKGGNPREIAVAEDGDLVEYLLDGESSAAEALYLGIVERVVPGMKAAFVDIGQEKNGFLPIEEKSQSVHLPKLQAGQRVLVQVKKDAQGTKGAFLTRDVTLCGEYLLLMPMNRYIGVSGRIEDEETRDALKKLGRELSGGRFGLVMRASTANASAEDISQELDELWSRWDAISKTVPTAHAPSVIDRPRTMLESLLDDYLPRGVDKVITDDSALAYQLDVPCPVEVRDKNLMAVSGMEKQRDKALERYVWLKSGGSLVIDRCEAMTVIDVNTAKFTGKKNVEETILRLNLEACEEIARQVRLRNLGGIILIDMIDMEQEEHRHQVLERLRDAFSADRVKTVIHGYTSLGLIEMTRKKSSRTLDMDWTNTCPRCKGTGRIIKEENHG